MFFVFLNAVFAKAPVVPLSLFEADGFLLEDASVFDGPGEGARQVGRLAAKSLVKVQARGLLCVPMDAERCAERWLVAGPKGAVWVEGGALVLRESVLGLEHDLGSYLLNYPPWSKDAIRLPGLSWYGVQTTWEREEGGVRGRIEVTGWLVTADDHGQYQTQLGYYSGWGSDTLIKEVRWVDLDGDAVAELLVLASTDITEVGYGGQVIYVFGPDLSPRLEIAVGDPLLTGLPQGMWGSVRLEGARLVQDRVEVQACPVLPAPPEAGSVVCFKSLRTTWEKLVPTEEPLSVTVEGAPVVAWAHPDGAAPIDAAPVWVLVQKGGQLVWVREPVVSPAWLLGVFSADPARGGWVSW